MAKETPKNGSYTEYYDNGQIKLEENYKDSKLDGKRTRWHENGQIEIEGAETMPVRPVRGQLLHLDWPTTRLNRVVWAADDCYLVPWTDGSVLVGATVEDVGFD